MENNINEIKEKRLQTYKIDNRCVQNRNRFHSTRQWLRIKANFNVLHSTEKNAHTPERVHVHANA